MAAPSSWSGVMGGSARQPFMSQSVSERRAEVEAWSNEQVCVFLGALGLSAAGVSHSGARLWHMTLPPVQPIDGSANRSPLHHYVQIMRRYERDGHAHLCQIMDTAVSAVRRASHRSNALASASAAAAAAATSYPSSAAAAPLPLSTAPKRSADSLANEPAAKRACPAGSAAGDHQRRLTHPAAAALSGFAVPRTAMFRELAFSGNSSTPKATPLQTDSLPQDWFVDAVPDDLICCICTEVARDPPNLETCGHAVCRDCLSQHRQRSSSCPLCRQSFTRSKLASQPFVQSMVWRLRVRCVQHDKGCGWQGQLGTDWRNLKAHDAVCPFKEATCPVCAKVCIGAERLDHPDSCPARVVQCTSCDVAMLFSRLADHQPALRSMTGAVDGAGRHASSSASSSAAGAQGAGAGASSSAAPPVAVSFPDLLPPIIPPCIFSEACPHGCEDPNHPGHLCVYPKSQRPAHVHDCTQRPVDCPLCHPAHQVAPRHVHAHVAAVLADPQRRAPVQHQLAQMILHGAAFFRIPTAAAAGGAATFRSGFGSANAHA